MELFFILWVLCGFISYAIATKRGGSGCLWFGLGALLGPIGILLAFLAGDTRPCPHCRRSIDTRATRCPECQGELSQGKDDSEIRALLAPGRSRDIRYRCSRCKQPLDREKATCPGCGVIVDWPAVAPPPAPAAAAALKKCPDCAESILVEARKCRFCGYRYE